MTTSPQSMPQAAVEYAMWGLPILRCAPGKKRPLTRHGLKDASTDTDQITKWFKKHPDANIGLLTGAKSGLIVVDVDPRNGGDDTLYELEQKFGSLPETWESQTGGGGRHLFFRHPGGHIKGSAGALGPGLDVKADGGYVIAPPSIHESGRPYVWEVDHDPHDTTLADPPDWLIQMLRERRHNFVLPDVIPEGQRNVTLTRWAGHLRAQGLDKEAILEDLRLQNRDRCQPPLSDRELSAIAHSIGQKPLGTSHRAPVCKERFVKVPPSILSMPDLSDGAFRLWALVKFRSWKRACQVPLGQLATAMGSTPRRISRLIQELEARGMITVTRPMGQPMQLSTIDPPPPPD